MHGTNKDSTVACMWKGRNGSMSRKRTLLYYLPFILSDSLIHSAMGWRFNDKQDGIANDVTKIIFWRQIIKNASK